MSNCPSIEGRSLSPTGFAMPMSAAKPTVPGHFAACAAPSLGRLEQRESLRLSQCFRLCIPHFDQARLWCEPLRAVPHVRDTPERVCREGSGASGRERCQPTPYGQATCTAASACRLRTEVARPACKLAVMPASPRRVLQGDVVHQPAAVNAAAWPALNDELHGAAGPRCKARVVGVGYDSGRLVCSRSALRIEHMPCRCWRGGPRPHLLQRCATVAVRRQLQPKLVSAVNLKLG